MRVYRPTYGSQVHTYTSVLPPSTIHPIPPRDLGKLAGLSASSKGIMQCLERREDPGRLGGWGRNKVVRIWGRWPGQKRRLWQTPAAASLHQLRGSGPGCAAFLLARKDSQNAAPLRDAMAGVRQPSTCGVEAWKVRPR